MDQCLVDIAINLEMLQSGTYRVGWLPHNMRDATISHANIPRADKIPSLGRVFGWHTANTVSIAVLRGDARRVFSNVKQHVLRLCDHRPGRCTLAFAPGSNVSSFFEDQM